jgi:hypothetical protein
MNNGNHGVPLTGPSIEQLLTALGERFIGLWIYKPFSGQGKRYWFVTFRDAGNQLWETDRAESPAAALGQALECLARQNGGEHVNPEVIGWPHPLPDGTAPYRVKHGQPVFNMDRYCVSHQWLNCPFCLRDNPNDELVKIIKASL